MTSVEDIPAARESVVVRTEEVKGEITYLSSIMRVSLESISHLPCGKHDWRKRHTWPGCCD